MRAGQKGYTGEQTEMLGRKREMPRWADDPMVVVLEGATGLGLGWGWRRGYRMVVRDEGAGIGSWVKI